MAKLAFETNKHLKDKNLRLNSMLKSMRDSFEIEGIHLSDAEVKLLSDQVEKDLISSKKKPS